MKTDAIVCILSDITLSEKEKYETICNTLQEYCLQPNHILSCYRVLNTLKLELTELFKDVDSGAEKILRRVINAITTELEIVKYQIKHPGLIITAKDEMPKFKRKHWTASIPGLVEIIYLIKDSVDNGDVDIKEIADWFEYIFQVKLKNIYKIIEQIAKRQNTKTKFLDEQVLNFRDFLENFSIRKPGRNKK